MALRAYQNNYDPERDPRIIAAVKRHAPSALAALAALCEAVHLAEGVSLTPAEAAAMLARNSGSRERIRLRITDAFGNVSYLTRADNGHIEFVGAGGTPHHMGNFFGSKAREAEFIMEDADNAASAAGALAQLVNLRADTGGKRAIAVVV